MKNPWGLEGKNPWKKDKTEPSLEKKSNPWGLSGNKPWGKEETDKERIARLEKEVEDLKNNNKQEQDDSWIDKQGFIPKPKKKKKSGGMGCLFWFALIALGFYLLFPDKEKVPSNNSSSTSETKTTTSKPKPSKYGEIGDNNKYLICYGEMTELYKQNGLHERNRSASIEAKETICRSYSRGEHDDFPRR